MFFENFQLIFSTKDYSLQLIILSFYQVNNTCTVDKSFNSNSISRKHRSNKKIEMDQESVIRQKVVVVGDGVTGKTSLIYRVSNVNEDLPEFPPTVMNTQIIK